MFLPFVKPVFANAWTDINAACVGPEALPGTGSIGIGGVPAYNASDVATIRGIECVIINILSFVPKVMALVAVAMIIMSGVRIITAGAEPKAYAAAWQQFTWAIIGLILLAGVWLVLVAIERFTGASVTQFGIPD